MAAEEPLETLFGSCVLEVFTPDTSISFPEGAIDDWLVSVKKPHAERRQAFFDEQLNLLLVIYIKHSSLDNPHDHRNPPRSLVGLLSHVQVSLDATYISQNPDRNELDTANLASSRPSSKPLGRPLSVHPSIFPPNTPTPIPSTAESDRKYVQSEGIPLFSSIWGTKRAKEGEKFTLLFSEAQRSWVAVYQLSLIVSYLRLPFPDPLICLTVSTTLRDKALSPSQSTHPFVAYLVRMRISPRLDLEATTSEEGGEEDEETDNGGFEEINLLEGITLTNSSILPDSQPLHFPSTRLGNTTRRRLFSLPPVSASARTPPSTSKQAPSHILRKSYRKVLQAVSGFRVRMRTVFVPHVLLPKNSTSDGGPNAQEFNDLDNGNEEREAGNSERTVILCVEVENSGESGSSTGFSLEWLDVKIGGEGATTRLIGWGEGAFDLHIEKHLFPLRIGSMEQYNLLYVVSFWSTPNDQENLLMATRDTRDGTELQRSVAIIVHGRPYITDEVKDERDILSYPTQTFTSQWNCILDLSTKPREELADVHEPSVIRRNVLPEPPSPFPGLTAFSPLSTHAKAPQAIAGKRHTLPGSITAMRAINPPSNLRLSLPSREHPGSTAPPVPMAGYTPPSVAMQTFNRSSSTMSAGAVNTPLPQVPGRPFVTPPTPPYPVFPSGLQPNTPHAHALGSQQGHSGPSIDIRREKGVGIANAMPQTPLPTVMNAQIDNRRESRTVPSGEPVVVSVGLLPEKSDDGCLFGQRKIYPSDQFTLDIFVYNQSSWTRRFEISYPDAGERQTQQIDGTPESRGKTNMEDLKASIVPPGILPLQNRVRVGPLKPSTCQSVRMDFLAISPGVHSVDLLTLTDVESLYAVNLRSVMDVVVHEHTLEEEKGFIGSTTLRT